MEISRNTRQRIIDSATELFTLHSYLSVGVQAVCEHAGVNKGSFYHFFPSKRDLAVAVLERLWRDQRERIWQPALEPSLPPADRIARLFTRLADRAQSEQDACGRVCGCAFGNLASELSTGDDSVRRKVEVTIGEMAGYLRDALGHDHAELAETVLATLQGGQLLAKTQNNPAIIAETGASIGLVVRTGHK